MRTVLLLATGDTIAQRPTRSSVASGVELLATVGPLPYRVVVEDVIAEPGWDMPVGTMLALARRIQKALGEFDGVVVAQGLESIEDSALLADMLVGGGGVVFTGARRYLDDPYTDGPANLRVALDTAADPRSVGVMVCVDGAVRPARGDLPAWPVLVGEPETDVALVHAYPGMPESVVTSAVDAGARGVVLAGSANGSVPVELFTTISELTSWDIPVVVPVTSTDSSVGPALVAKVGAIHAMGFTGRQARIALMVALARGGVSGVREWFGG
ncbi:asparaginase [Kibdelosporangium lantanae]